MQEASAAAQQQIAQSIVASDLKKQARRAADQHDHPLTLMGPSTTKTLSAGRKEDDQSGSSSIPPTTRPKAHFPNVQASPRKISEHAESTIIAQVKAANCKQKDRKLQGGKQLIPIATRSLLESRVRVPQNIPERTRQQQASKQLQAIWAEVTDQAGLEAVSGTTTSKNPAPEDRQQLRKSVHQQDGVRMKSSQQAPRPRQQTPHPIAKTPRPRQQTPPLVHVKAAGHGPKRGPRHRISRRDPDKGMTWRAV